MRIRRAFLAPLLPFLLSACGDDPPTPKGYPGPSVDPPGSPPALGDLFPDPSLGEPAIDRGRELFVTDRALLSSARSDGANKDAPWSFRHVVEAMAAPGDASAFVRGWLAAFEAKSTDATDGNLPLDARVDVRKVLACPWLKLTPANGCDASCTQCASETYDLARAPFRLVAIVDRLDLAESTTGCDPNLAEGRFVFVATQPGSPQTHLAMNVIFEFGVNGTKAGDPAAWHALGALAGEPYAAGLEKVTRSFSDRAPGAPSLLKQVRTSENLGAANGTSFELRQFELRDGKLVPAALTNTARDDINGTTAFGEHVQTHMMQIMSGDNAITFSQRTAVSTLVRPDQKWIGPGGENNPAVELFGLSTCNGCHGGHRGDTTVLPFAHVGIDSNGDPILSRFLSDPENPESDELAFRGRSLVRRLQGRCGAPEASYGGRRGIGGGLGGEKIPPKRDAIARTH